MGNSGGSSGLSTSTGSKEHQRLLAATNEMMQKLMVQVASDPELVKKFNDMIGNKQAASTPKTQSKAKFDQTEWINLSRGDGDYGTKSALERFSKMTDAEVRAVGKGMGLKGALGKEATLRQNVANGIANKAWQGRVFQTYGEQPLQNTPYNANGKR